MCRGHGRRLSDGDRPKRVLTVADDGVPVPLPPIVYVTATPPWPITSGGRIRTAANLDALSGLGPCHLVAFPPAPFESTALPLETRLASLSIHVVERPGPVTRLSQRLESLAHLAHPYVTRWKHAGGPEVLLERVRAVEAGIVVLEWPFYPAAISSLRTHGSFVAADVGDDRIAMSAGLIRNGPGIVTRLRALLDHPAFLRSERGIGRADQAWFVRGADARGAAIRHRGLDTRVIPNVVDEPRLAAVASTSAAPAARSAAFLGSFDYAPNEVAGLRFARGLAPILRREAPDATLALIGRNPTGAIRQAALNAGIGLLADVPDAGEALRRFAALVVPLASGSGTSLKILEALALRVPVVATPVAIAGLDLLEGVHVLVGRSDEDLAASVLRVWNEPLLAERLAEAGSSLVHERYGPAAHVRLVADALRLAQGGSVIDR